MQVIPENENENIDKSDQSDLSDQNEEENVIDGSSEYNEKEYLSSEELSDNESSSGNDSSSGDEINQQSQVNLTNDDLILEQETDSSDEDSETRYMLATDAERYEFSKRFVSTTSLADTHQKKKAKN